MFDRPSGQIESDQENANLVQQIKDLQERLDQLERYALTSQNIIANKIGVGINVVMADIVDGDIATIPWTDYSNISTITGWSSFTVKEIFYKKMGRFVVVQWRLNGTSNATAANFTLPYTVTDTVYIPIATRDNSGVRTIGIANPTGTTAYLFKDPTLAGWTAAGTKEAAGQFWFDEE